MNEVILMSDVDGLGLAGDVVKVANGYARNFLLPKKLAAPVTETTRRQLESIRKEREARDIEELSGAEALAKKLDNLSCTIPVKTSEDGKLYGSVNASQILGALKQQGTKVGSGKLQLAEPIKELGVYDLTIKLHTKVSVPLKVWVVEE